MDVVVPVALLIDELRSNDMATRLHAFNNLTTIADALGPERTRDELLPYLGDFIDDDDVLFILADELAKLISYIGGF